MRNVLVVIAALAACNNPPAATPEPAPDAQPSGAPAEASPIGVPISGRGLLALREGMLTDPAVLKEVKRLTRAALAEQLNGRALKTRELYRFKREG